MSWWAQHCAFGAAIRLNMKQQADTSAGTWEEHTRLLRPKDWFFIFIIIIFYFSTHNSVLPSALCLWEGAVERSLIHGG